MSLFSGSSQVFMLCRKCNASSVKHLITNFNFPVGFSSKTSSFYHTTSTFNSYTHQTNEYIKRTSYLKDKNHYSPVEQREAKIQQSESNVQYVVSKEDFKWVQRLMPPSVIPDPLKHDKYPTPSGWSPPSETVPNLPYFVERNRYHVLAILEVQKIYGRVLTVVTGIDGDIWALEKDLIEVVRPHMTFDPATRVHEVTRKIYIKGRHKNVIEKFLYDQGF